MLIASKKRWTISTPDNTPACVNTEGSDVAPLLLCCPSFSGQSDTAPNSERTQREQLAQPIYY